MRALARTMTLAALVGVSCAGAPEPTAEVPPRGPPRIQASVVARHAREFDRDLTRRPAGSQDEAAAATYILGHLQRAGYVVRLVAVPVADLVSSLDLVALPPGPAEPETVVAVTYDSTSPPATAAGESIGLFLELARALRAAEPRHNVELVALGAEHARIGDGYLGSRRLVRFLEEAGNDPLVVTIEPEGHSAPERVTVLGAADGLGAAAAAADVRVVTADASEAGEAAMERHSVFTLAGLQHAGVSGASADVGRLLLEYLSSP
jgi:hypothetical protein